jgi:hypothetical protein
LDTNDKDVAEEVAELKAVVTSLQKETIAFRKGVFERLDVIAARLLELSRVSGSGR